MTITFHAREFRTVHEALQWADAGGGVPILLDRPMVATQDDVDRLAAAGVAFAFLIDHELPDGARRIMTIPTGR